MSLLLAVALGAGAGPPRVDDSKGTRTRELEPRSHRTVVEVPARARPFPHLVRDAAASAEFRDGSL
jgi:hypothetical protein